MISVCVEASSVVFASIFCTKEFCTLTDRDVFVFRLYSALPGMGTGGVEVGGLGGGRGRGDGGGGMEGGGGNCISLVQSVSLANCPRMPSAIIMYSIPTHLSSPGL